jgi:hypothetical protein
MEGEIFLRAQELLESNRQLRETNDELARIDAERAESRELGGFAAADEVLTRRLAAGCPLRSRDSFLP